MRDVWMCNSMSRAHTACVLAALLLPDYILWSSKEGDWGSIDN
jgi:hypothetical protein